MGGKILKSFEDMTRRFQQRRNIMINFDGKIYKYFEEDAQNILNIYGKNFEKLCRNNEKNFVGNLKKILVTL